MNRRKFLAAVPAFCAVRSLLAADAGDAAARLGLCTFSCHQHWQAVRNKEAGTRFHDAASFFDYAIGLGADGVQTGLRDAESAKAIRSRLDRHERRYYEADLQLPEPGSDLESFEAQVKLARDAGASVARTVLLGGRRYETFKTLEAFRAFRARSERRLAQAEPILRRHRLKLAVENHKDYLAAEFLDLLHKIGSEWIGALVDTGNNMALLEEPHAVVEQLAPLAMSVHFKDMAVQIAPNGLLLSEVVLGEGCLDLPRIVRTLRKANPRIIFNIEMATRDPLSVPCLTDAYWATFPQRRAGALDPALEHARSNPPRHPVPAVAGLDMPARLALEEANNRACLAYRPRLPA